MNEILYRIGIGFDNRRGITICFHIGYIMYAVFWSAKHNRITYIKYNKEALRLNEMWFFGFQKF